jgi:hypothetical protein
MMRMTMNEPMVWPTAVEAEEHVEDEEAPEAAEEVMK